MAKSTAQVVTVPAPIGGLNAFDPLAAMPATDAVVMNNCFPQPYGCLIRRGYVEHSTGIVGEVRSLLVYNGSAGSSKMFAMANSSMYDVTNPGPVAEPILQGLSDEYWQYVNFANSAGVHLVSVNGEDNGIVYNDSGLNRLKVGDGVAPYTVKGADPALWVSVTSHQRRLWFVQKDSTLGWYLPTDQLYGEAKKFDFGPLFKKGGHLQLLSTWTVDSGEGSNDHLVAISSRGELVVYAGIDVNDPADWKQKGVYYVGSPVSGHRFATKVGGDLYILTQVGVVSLATLITSTQVNVSTDTTESRKIQYLISEVVGNYYSSPDWDIQFYPSINMLMINYKDYTLYSHQIVENMITKAWCTFSDIAANCWALYNESPFFGGNKAVYRAWTGEVDGVKLDGTGGTSIRAQIQQAYSYLGQPSTQKQVGMYRPNLMVDAPTAFNSSIQYDFAFDELTAPNAYRDRSSAFWDESRWGASYWSGGYQVQRDWIQAFGIGTAASIRLAIVANIEVLWVSTDYTFVTGGPL